MVAGLRRIRNKNLVVVWRGSYQCCDGGEIMTSVRQGPGASSYDMVPALFLFNGYTRVQTSFSYFPRHFLLLQGDIGDVGLRQCRRRGKSAEFLLMLTHRSFGSAKGPLFVATVPVK